MDTSLDIMRDMSEEEQLMVALATIEAQEIEEAVSMVEALQIVDKDEPQEKKHQNEQNLEERAPYDLEEALERIRILEETLALYTEDQTAAQKYQNANPVQFPNMEERNFTDFLNTQAGNSQASSSQQSDAHNCWQCQVCRYFNTDNDSNNCEVCCSGRNGTDCPICMEQIDLNDLFIAEMCGHQFHKECAKETILTDMRQNLVPICCPQCKASQCAQCVYVHPQNQKECCIVQQSQVRSLLDTRDYERYLTIEIKETCKSFNFFQCPVKVECGNYYEIDEDQERFDCPGCKFSFCLPCGVPYHQGLTCAQYQNWRKENSQVDEKFEELRNQLGMKTCPKCKMHVIKDSPQQCNKITCNNCRPSIFFCWICGQQISGYKHFSDKSSPCYNKLWQGVRVNE
eukprot:TRINITY_DN4150_c0_g1_i8.p2 TRINITY_DN4150_c0_g1~~TRINITY_DN4150_c0_g1_i8.p2  ORF type:complete len:400 (-),score=39.49 TRINITY_DN4150_c0_g1_i8:2003-3202(-)